MAGFDLSALNAQLGAYYRMNRAELLRKLYAQEEVRQYFQVIPGVQDEYVMTEIEVEEVVQPTNPNAEWSPKGVVAFKPEIIKVRDGKVDLPLKLKDLEKKWIGYLKNNGSSPQEFPFVAYIYERIIERIARDLNRCTINGVYTVPTTTAAGSALHMFNGLLKVYADAVTDGKINVNPTGALLRSTIIDQVEETYDSVPGEFKEMELAMLISPDWKREYFRRKRDVYGSNIDYDPMNATVDFTTCRMVSPKYMNGSQKIIITPASNLILCEDGINEEESLMAQMNRRTLELMGDFKRGVGFGIIEGFVWGNDQ